MFFIPALPGKPRRPGRPPEMKRNFQIEFIIFLNNIRDPTKPGEPRSPVTPLGPALPGGPALVAVAISPG